MQYSCQKSEENGKEVKIFADDIQILENVDRQNNTITDLTKKMEATANRVLDYLYTKGLTIESGKSELVTFCREKQAAAINIKGKTVFYRPQLKYLGVKFDEELSFLPHVANRATGVAATTGRLIQCNRKVGGLPSKVTALWIKTTILPSGTYASEAWFRSTTTGHGKPLQDMEVNIN